MTDEQKIVEREKAKETMQKFRANLTKTKTKDSDKEKAWQGMEKIRKSKNQT